MSAIAQRAVGQTGLRLTELGFGGAPVGNLYRPMSDAEAADTITAALEAGLTYFDTAPHYGRGLSERRLGDALRTQPGITLSTKVGRILDVDATLPAAQEHDGFVSPMPFRARYDYTYDGVLRSHEHSLQRLGLGRIDLLYIHDIGRKTHHEAADRYWSQLTDGGGLRALGQLRDDGAISGFGVGVNEVDVCLDVMREARIDVILLAGRYTLLEQEALDELMPACAETGTSVVIGGPYNSGILATGTRSIGIPHYDYAPAPDAIVAKVRQIEEIAARHGVLLPAAALQFALAHPSVVSVIPGLGSVALVSDTVALLDAPIPDEFWSELRRQGLLRPDAPTPERGS